MKAGQFFVILVAVHSALSNIIHVGGLFCCCLRVHVAFFSLHINSIENKSFYYRLVFGYCCNDDGEEMLRAMGFRSVFG